jgi:hypothetical protein
MYLKAGRVTAGVLLGLQVVKPKREKMRATERALKEANKKLDDKRASLQVGAVLSHLRLHTGLHCCVV